MRALVSIFAGLLILISVYQLSFTWFVNKHESTIDAKAKKYVNGLYQAPMQKYPADKEARALYQDTVDQAYNQRRKRLLDSSNDTKITWWGTSYQKSKENELLLGLDLQGGISVTLNVGLDALIKSLANNPRDPQLLKAIDLASQKKISNDANLIDLFTQSYKELYPGSKLAPLFANANNNKIKFDASDDAVSSYLHDQEVAAMNQTYKILQLRIDKFGVAQPSISLDPNRGIISVELAGATDPDRVRKYLQSTANLQFWETYNTGDLEQSIATANKSLQNYLNGVKDTAASKPDTTGGKHDTTTNSANENALYKVIAFTPGQQDQKTGRQQFPSYIARARLQDTATANDYLNNPVVRNSFPPDLKFLWGKQQLDENGKPIPYLDLYAVRTIPGSEKARIEGDAIEDANQDFDPMTGEVLVEMSMKKQGAQEWAKMTTKNVGKPVAIVLDDIVYSAPLVNEPITGGSSRITMGGGKTDQAIAEAQDLANILKSGKLDAPPKIVQEEVVGPTLGKEAINGGMMAFAISFGVIFLLMVGYSNTAGWVANIALILNLLFTIGVLSALHATLTAPGIAALVLTVGMAVDTNVIIFERIKEELTRGKTYQLAVHDDGYSGSPAPVLDAHVTNLLTALILFYFGLGPVLGFATTQILGILLSLFCGILISRLITDYYTNKNRHFKYFTPVSSRIFKHAAFKFIEYRKVAYFISVVVLILGVSTFFHGFKEGVEFQGGRSYVINFHKPVSYEQILDALKKTSLGVPEIKTYGSNEQLEITTDYLIKQEGPQVDSIVESVLYTGLKPFLPQDATLQEFVSSKKYVQGTKKVTPIISTELKSGAYRATIIALIIIFLYIFIRFRDWRYSLGTIIALFHDIFVTLAVFSFLHELVPFPLELDQHFIAALLTVIGFSMNDTVIVFDRIRENSHLMKNATNAEIINKSVNDTLSRTIMTSLTVFLTLLILFLVGGEVTRGFAFAMLIGVITGTYSSIFVAAPFLVDFAKGRPLGGAKGPAVPETSAGRAKPATAQAKRSRTSR